jgi:hypothetical protein
MALNYASSVLSVGNNVFGADSNHSIQLRGGAFLDSRYLLLLIKNNSTNEMVWKKLDTLSTSTVSYDIAIDVNTIAEASDWAAQGQYLAVDNGFIYYLKGSSLVKVNATSGEIIGSNLLRRQSGAATTASSLRTMNVLGNNLYVTSQTDGIIIRYDLSTFLWNGTNRNAITERSVSHFGSHDIMASFIQSGSTEFVVMLKGPKKVALKFTSDLAEQLGTGSSWSDPSDNIVSAQFSGSILYVLACNDSLAGTGVQAYRFGDASTGEVDEEHTIFSVSSNRVRVGSGQVVTLKYSARDGYGLVFTPEQAVRFSLIRIGDIFDSNDGALSLNANGPFRGPAGDPLAVTLDVPFDGTGSATCYWHTPLEIPVKELLHRIRVRYPIYG